MDEYTCDGWACVDCYVLLANGDGPTDKTEAELEAYDQAIALNTAGYNLTMGMLAEKHACATNYTVSFADGTQRDVRADNQEDAQDKAEWAYSHDVKIISAVAHDLQTRGDLGGECECETNSFSSSACDVCGSNLGGERHAVSFWKILPEDNGPQVEAATV